jgi:hypothetical protein
MNVLKCFQIVCATYMGSHISILEKKNYLESEIFKAMDRAFLYLKALGKFESTIGSIYIYIMKSLKSKIRGCWKASNCGLQYHVFDWFKFTEIGSIKLVHDFHPKQIKVLLSAVSILYNVVCNMYEDFQKKFANDKKDII